MRLSTRNKIVMIVTAALMIIVIFGIIYASVTNRLTIVRNTPNTGYFKISFDNLRPVRLVGTAKEVVKPTINRNETRISNYAVSVATPGDSIEYTFDVVNKGTYNALISHLIVPIPHCFYIKNGILRTDTNFCKNLNYTLKYQNGSKVKIGDTLKIKERRTMVLTLYYNAFASATSLPKRNIAIDNLDIWINYVQCDRKCNVVYE